MIESERESQLSAMFDGELTTAECELVARRLAKDESLRRSWEHYSLIGAVLRDEPIARRQLAPRVQADLEAETSAVAGAAAKSAAAAPLAEPAQTAASRGTRWLRPLSGLGAAAAVGALAFVVLQNVESPAPELVIASAEIDAVEEVVIPAAGSSKVEVVLARRPVGSSESVDTAAAYSSGEPQSYVTPPYNPSSAGRLAAPAQMANFVVAHSSVAAPMLRHGMLSSFIASAPAEDIADETATPEPVVLEREVRGDLL